MRLMRDGQIFQGGVGTIPLLPVYPGLRILLWPTVPAEAKLQLRWPDGRVVQCARLGA